MIYRLIAPKWLNKQVLEGEFTDEQIRKYNQDGYNIYHLPNYPSRYTRGVNITGADIDVFSWVFVDCDLKDKLYADKNEFLEALGLAGISVSKVVDSGNGIHAYWKVSNLDAMSYLRFQRRLMRLFSTDEAVGQLFQLMRLPGTMNTKAKDAPVPCIELMADETQYTAEELDRLLPPITLQDEAYCKQHYDRTYGLNQNVAISDSLPAKFGKLLKDNTEAKELFAGVTDDRSKADYRLGHLMFANGFTKEEALSVLVNTAKALQRAPIHRTTYATNIVDKIWTFEFGTQAERDKLDLSDSVEDILQQSNDSLKGIRLTGHSYIDNTEHGFRLSQVIGLVAGVGVGKTAISMNLFQGFVKNNPQYTHLFVSLEQPAREIAERWEKLCQGDTRLHSKVHILSNYNKDGTYRNLSLYEIQDYILAYEKKNDIKFGCVVIDHLGVLKKQSRNGENEGLIQVCQQLKSFAIVTNTLLVIQSQSNREKSGIGDLELSKDSAYGTQAFESFLDFLICAWQPVKRQYINPACPTITAFKFAKIRFKNKEVDIIKEDVRYLLYFDTKTGILRPTTQDEDTSFQYFNNICANLRRSDRKTEIVPYISVRWGEPTGEEKNEIQKRH